MEEPLRLRMTTNTWIGIGGAAFGALAGVALFASTRGGGEPRPRNRASGLEPGPAEGGHNSTNRLATEKSPYLLQHAHNPVDWYPWGEEAFAKAREQNKPIFLSVGYSTCHWCHVMERESFEDEEIAAVLNRHFVPRASPVQAIPWPWCAPCTDDSSPTRL
jgi:hypothetical protein